MAKTILYDLPALGDFAVGREIRSSSWTALARGQCSLFGTRGTLHPGRTASGATRLCFVTDPSYTQVAFGGAPTALRDWSAIAQGWRDLADTQAVRLELDWYGQHLDLRLTARTQDDPEIAPTSHLLDSAGGSTSVWRKGVLTLTAAQARFLAGDARWLLLSLQARRRASASEGSLWAWRVRELVLRAGDETLIP